MTDLNFSVGRQTFNLNGVVEVSFNDTDADFVERLFNVFAKLDEKQDGYKERVDKMADKREVFKVMRELDDDIRDDINVLFDKDVCTPLFGTMNVFALADGLPLWANLLLAIMDQVDSAFAREQKNTNPRVLKYTAKWQKK
jgi:hypothetical protein